MHLLSKFRSPVLIFSALNYFDLLSPPSAIFPSFHLSISLSPPPSHSFLPFLFLHHFKSSYAKVREASTTMAEKAEKDMQMWIEGTIGRELNGHLAQVLRSGEVLCELLNKIKPGLVKKYHTNTRMAFKQMENIGWFIEGCKDFGVTEVDLFMTVDLFDCANIRQVRACFYDEWPQFDF